MNVHEALDSLTGRFWITIRQEDFDKKQHQDRISFSPADKTDHGFGVEKTAACGKARIQIPVCGLLSGAHGGMYKEMVSVWTEIICFLCMDQYV